MAFQGLLCLTGSLKGLGQATTATSLPRHAETGALTSLYLDDLHNYKWVAGDVSEDDDLYCASLKGDRTTHTVDQINAALHKIPNENVFFPLPAPWHFARTGPITVADTWDTEPGPEFYLKRPTFPLSLDCEPDDEFWAGRKDAAYWFTAEVRMLERLSRFPQHPNIVKYHGCRVRKGRVTGVMLDRCEGQDLYHHCLVAGKKVDKEPFLAALASAIDHLHNVVGIVHNDISPIHIMVSPDGTPTLIDFGSAEIAEEEITGGRPFIPAPHPFPLYLVPG